MKKFQNPLKRLLTLLLICTSLVAFSQNSPGAVQGQVIDIIEEPIPNVAISVMKGSETIAGAVTDEDGRFSISNLSSGKYKMCFKHISYGEKVQNIHVKNKVETIHLTLMDETIDLADIIVTSRSRNLNDISRLPSVKGTAIFASKKNDVILMDKMNANLAVNNPRQVFAKVAGTNIWENDGTGIQLNVSNRGLSPNRSWEYNTRQNGYDIAADILGYPDNYYTPTMEAIERIEVVRGSASLQYGTQLGGMLNFRLKRAPKNKDFEFNTKQTVGSFNLFNSYSSVGGRNNKVEYFGYFHHRSADGWRENADYRIKTSGYGSVRFNVSEKFDVGVEMTKMGYTLHLSAGVTDEQFAIDPQVSVRERNWFRVAWNLPAITLDYNFGNGTKLSMRNFAILSSRYSIENTDPVNIPDDGGFRDLRRDEYRNYGSEIKFLSKYKLFPKTKNTFLIGTRVYKGKTTRGQGLGMDGNDPVFHFINPDAVEYNNYTFNTKNIAVFGEHIFQITPKLSVTPGFRYEHINVDFNGYYNEDGLLRDEDRQNTRNFPLFGVGVQYQINNDINFYANITQGFRGVHFNDMRVENPNIEVDPNVKDSDGYNSDIGFRGQIKEIVNFDVNAFILAYNNRIGSTTRMIDGLPQLYRTNIADSRNMGIESFVELNILKALRSNSPYSLSLFSSYAYVHSEYLNSDFKGNRVELAPEHLLKAGISFKGYHFSTTLNYTYTSSQYSDANNTESSVTGNQGLIPSYTVLDFSVNYDIKKYTLSLGVNNLLDRTYFTRRATSYPGPGVIPAEPRHFYFTLAYKI